MHYLYVGVFVQYKNVFQHNKAQPVANQLFILVLANYLSVRKLPYF